MVVLISNIAMLLAESVTVMVIVNDPALVGVPDITPVTEFNVSPAGSVPVVTANVYGATPPEAVIVALYPTPMLAAGRLFVVIANCARMVIVYDCEAITAGVSASVTCTVKVLVPAVIGVPERTPVPDAIAIPAGSVPEDTENVYGANPPVTVIVVWYTSPTMPLGIVGVVMDTAPALTTRVSVFVALSCADTTQGKSRTKNRNHLRNFTVRPLF
jgi:hypothetical protein